MSNPFLDIIKYCQENNLDILFSSVRPDKFKVVATTFHKDGIDTEDICEFNMNKDCSDGEAGHILSTIKANFELRKVKDANSFRHYIKTTSKPF